jgi:hypothetical protein
VFTEQPWSTPTYVPPRCAQNCALRRYVHVLLLVANVILKFGVCRFPNDFAACNHRYSGLVHTLSPLRQGFSPMVSSAPAWSCHQHQLERLLLGFLDLFSRVCRARRGLIRKYDLFMCRRCFSQYATQIGFQKVTWSGIIFLVTHCMTLRRPHSLSCRC